MKEGLLTCSEKYSSEYCCTIVQIGECFPIEGSDRIQRTVVNGNDVVISKDIKPGDIMIYVSNETALDPMFLALNNLYDWNNRELNSNIREIDELLFLDKKEEARQLCGFFTTQYRVKLLKLRGVYSHGFLFPTKMLTVFNQKMYGYDYSGNIGKDFDCINGKLFVKPYVPRTIRAKVNKVKIPQKEYRFERIEEEGFPFHYETQQLQRNIGVIGPDDVVTISVKMHGTSAIYARTECKILDKIALPKRLWNMVAGRFGLKKFKDFHYGQDNVYASRTRIRDRYIDLSWASGGTEECRDVWGYFKDIFETVLIDNCYVYGEIIGFIPGSGTYIQKHYDYGNEIGRCRFMPYRVVYIIDGSPVELNVLEVKRWTEALIASHPQYEDRLQVIPVLYYGTLSNLYSDIPKDSNWHANILAAMKKDKKTLGMEKNESLCTLNTVPREGICIRLERGSAFKLKCDLFLKREGESIDNGEVDIEMQESI